MGGLPHVLPSLRLPATLSQALRRLRAKPGLSLATLAGLAVAVALLMSVPLYATAVYSQLLQEEVIRTGQRTNRPPFTSFFDYRSQVGGARQWEDVAVLHAYLSGPAPTLGLPVLYRASYLETGPFRLYPGQGATAGTPLGQVRFAVLNGLEEQITLVAGEFPTEGMEVLVTASFAGKMGLQVGDSLLAYDERHSEKSEEQRRFPVQVAGIWQPRDSHSDFWFKVPATFDPLLILPQATFTNRLSPALDDEVAQASWYLVLDGSDIGPGDVERLVRRATAVEKRARSLLPNLSLLLSPAEALGRFHQAVGQLSRSLAAFNVPLLGLIAIFTGLVGGLSVNERRNEMAVRRSRGTAAWQIVAMAGVEGLLLGLAALALGALLAVALSQLMGRTRTFLDFSGQTRLPLVMNGAAWRAGILGVALALLAQIWPSLAAARDNVVTSRLAGIRNLRPAWWQRAGLDLLLWLPALYGLYLWRQQGGLLLPESAANPWQNPLLLLAPFLALFAAALLCLRLLAYSLNLLSRLLARSRQLTLLLALRQLARTPRLFAAPLVLLIFTVSFSLFTASLARTLDRQLADEMFYRLGADVALAGQGPVGADASLFLPPSAYLELDGVAGATRVGRYPAATRQGRERLNITFLGIDRDTFAQVAFWRQDFAPYHLGYLLNALARQPDGVLLPGDFLARSGLQVGDFLEYSVTLPGGSLALQSQIVGSFAYFPTWYQEEDGPLLVGNLEALFAAAGSPYPYHVWLRTRPGFAPEQFAGQGQMPAALVQAEQARPERQGVFGLLSAGFVAAALLTVLGFFLYALFSFRRRFIEFAALQAIGLPARGVVALLAWELGALVALGWLLGTALGLWFSRLWISRLWISRVAIPLLPLAGEPGTGATPPYLVEIAWPAVAQVGLLFGLLFLLALGVLTPLLLRLKLFQALKLGETV